MHGDIRSELPPAKEADALDDVVETVGTMLIPC